MKRTVSLGLVFTMLLTLFSFSGLPAKAEAAAEPSAGARYGMAYSFDNQTEFRDGREFTVQGALTADGITLSHEADHTATMLGNGKSLKISGWSTPQDQIYLLNLISDQPLTAQDCGKAFKVTAYLLSSAQGSYFVGINSRPDSDGHTAAPYLSTVCTVSPEGWTRVSFTFVLTSEMCASGLKELVIGQDGTPSGAALLIDDISVTEIGQGIAFDDTAAFSEGTDYELLGGSAHSAALSCDLDLYANADSGKSLLISQRTSAADGVLLRGLIPARSTGAAYRLSCRIYAAQAATFRLGIYSDSGEYAAVPYQYNDISVGAGVWTECEISFVIDETITACDISLFGISEADAFGNTAFSIDQVISETDGYLYQNTGGKTADELFEQLRAKGGTVIYSPEQQTARVNEKAGGSGLTLQIFDDFSARVVPADGDCFTEAVHYSVRSQPSPAYKFQLNIGAIAKNSDGSRIVNPGDWIVGVVYIKALSTDAADQNCHFQFAVQDSVTGGKVLQADTYAAAGAGFQKVYIASKVGSYSNNLNLFVRCGYEIQEVEIGGVQLYCYSASVISDESEIPDTASFYDGMEPFSSWRTEADERIEAVRKGMITLKIKDADGNPIENCAVQLDQTEHAFQFGTTGSNLILKSTNDAEIYKDKLVTYFNAAVAESELKWVTYENDPEAAVSLVEQLKSLGIKSVRGHCLMWDCDFYGDKWKANTAIPYALAQAVDSNDREAVEQMICEHISSEMNAFSAYDLCDWDVVNEITYNHAITERYGRQPLLDWFAWADAANSSDSDLYINEAALTGSGDNELLAFREYLDYMVENQCRFDGIGLQGHFGNPCSINRYAAQLKGLSQYGKRLKITEYDIQKEGMIQAEFTRDMMILAFSMPQMDGFYNWGFWDGAHWLQNGLLYDADWNLKQSGEEYIDLVFNRWETHNSGVTDTAGEYTSRAYYGEYAVTVTVGGREYHQSIDFQSLESNVFELALDYRDVSGNYTVRNNTPAAMNVTQAAVDALGESLVFGKIAETDLSNAGDLSALTDGKIYLKHQDYATYIPVGGQQPVFTFDMGDRYTVHHILIGGCCMGSQDITLAQYELYVSESLEELYSLSSLVAVFDNTGVFDPQVSGWINSTGAAQIFDFSTCPTGRYFGIKIQKANRYDSYLRLSELGIYGEELVAKQAALAPAAPGLVKKTSSSVTLAAVEGMEYSIDAVTWQSSPYFAGLSAGMYDFYARQAETEDFNASPASAALCVRVHAMGDIDGNEAVNALDAVKLRKWLVGAQFCEDEFAVDVNEDGRVDIRDMVRLKKLITAD